MFIKLTGHTSEEEIPCWINMSIVRSIYEEKYADNWGFKTYVEYVDGNYISIKETPEEIMAKIKAKELMRD